MNRSALEILENVKGGVDVPILDPLNGEQLPNFADPNTMNVSPAKFNMAQPLSPIPAPKAAAVIGTKSPQAFLKQMATASTAHMTLEEKILNGVFKPDI